MHALRHVHRLLVPGGTLLDIHPLTEERVEAAGGVVGVIEEPQFVRVDLPNAEERLAAAIAARLYALEEETEIDVLQHFDEVDELLEAKRDRLDEQPALAERVRAAGAPLVTREHVVVRRLRALARPAVTRGR